MSNITLKDDYDSLAEALGMTSDKVSEKQSGLRLPRLKIIKEGVLGQTEVKGETKSYQVVDPGSFVLEISENDSIRKIYGKEAKVRMFMQRFKFERYVTEDKKYVNSVMSAAQFTEDLPDSNGTINCGRPHRGYVDEKTYESMSNSDQQLQKSTRRVRVILGLVTFSTAFNEAGEKIELDEPTPFVWDITNNTAFKVMGEIIGEMNASKILLPRRELVFGSEQKGEGDYKTYIPKVASKDNKDIKFKAKDQENLNMFLEWIKQTNTWVTNQGGSTEESSTKTIDVKPTIEEPRKVSTKKESEPAVKEKVTKVLDEWDDDEE